MSSFVVEHGHDLSTPALTCFLHGHRGITATQMAEISSYEIAGLKKKQIMDVMNKQHGRYDRVGFTTKDLYNFCDQRRKRNLDIVEVVRVQIRCDQLKEQQRQLDDTC